MANTAPVQSLIALADEAVVVVEDLSNDGSTVDTTEPLSFSVSDPTKLDVLLDPTNARAVILRGKIEGSASVNVLAPGVTSSKMLTIPVQIAPAPNLSEIRFVSATVRPRST